MADTPEKNAVLLDENVTLKSKIKRRRKNKHTKLQELYDAGKVTSEEFYKELLTFIKWRLMTDLIKKGYYIDGVRQSNFTRDECDACYTEVLEKIQANYDPEQGTLATYIRWKIRGWATKVIQVQRKNNKWNPQQPLSINSVSQETSRQESFKQEVFNLRSGETSDKIEESLDIAYYGVNIIDNITKDDIYTVRDGIKDVVVKGEWTKLWLD